MRLYAKRPLAWGPKFGRNSVIYWCRARRNFRFRPRPKVALSKHATVTVSQCLQTSQSTVAEKRGRGPCFSGGPPSAEMWPCLPLI